MMDLLGWENWKNWSDQLEKKHASSWSKAEILERIRRLEALHWKTIIAGGAIWSLGFSLLFISFSSGNTPTSVAGGTAIVVGLLLMLGAKLASTTCLCTYHILWDIRRGEEESIRKSEIEDL